MIDSDGTVDKLNSAFQSLFLSLFIIAIKHAPFKRVTIGFFALVQTWRIFKIKRGRLQTIEILRRRTGSILPSSLFALKYFIQQGKDNAWTLAFGETLDSLEGYLIIENKEPLVQAVSPNKGALLLGAHYGPPLYTYMLDMLGFDVRTLVSEENYRSFKNPQSNGKLSARKPASFLRETPSPTLPPNSQKH